MNKKIWLSPPHMGGKEFTYVQNAFETNWIAPLGPHVDGFESDLESYLGSNSHVGALSSGTAAIHLGLIILDVKQGDEVICQSMTFAASANPIMYQKATPIFVDSEEDTWNMSPEYLEIAILDRISKGKKPKAIIVVHLYGMPAKIDRIMEIAGRYEIPVIEDAAESLGSEFKGKKLGTFGDIGILSFNGNKIITTSGGGAIVSKNEDWMNRALFLATQARDLAPFYQHSEIGYNYRMSNVSAAIGRGQVEVLPLRIHQKRDIFDYYKKQLAGQPKIKFHDETTIDFYSNRWLTTITIEDESIKPNDIRIALEMENIESRLLWKPMHLQPVFTSSIFYGDGTCERLFNKGLCLPSGTNLSKWELDEVIDKIDKCFKETPKSLVSTH